MRYSGHYVVGDSAIEWPYEAFTWTVVPNKIQAWAAEVKRDSDTPDLWAQLRQERELFQGSRIEAINNTPFTQSEQAQVVAVLREIKLRVETSHHLSADEMDVIGARFDHLEAASKHMGRKDWLLIFLGTLVTLVIGDLLPAQLVQHMLALAVQSLGYVLGGGGLPGLPTP